MEKPPKLKLQKKNKRKSTTVITEASKPKALKIEKPEITIKPTNVSDTKNNILKQNKKVEKTIEEIKILEDAYAKYPILQDKELVIRFQKVPIGNNQKGRIRQAIRLQLKDSSDKLIPDAIHSKIQTLLNSSKDLTDAELRKIRILYNMLKTSVERLVHKPDTKSEDVKPKKEKKKKEPKVKAVVEGATEVEGAITELGDDEGEKKNAVKKEQLVNKPKGPKRYVVFVGNLPLDVDKEKIMKHFSDVSEQIKDIRLPEPSEGKKSAIAFLELSNEPSYEIALSKHHSMMGNKRINVLYTTQQNSKISKAEAKSKSAKLIALQKSGKLLGSVPLVKKRSHRRMKMKQAKAKEAAASA